MMGLSRVLVACVALVALAVASGCDSGKQPSATPSGPAVSPSEVPSGSAPGAGTPSDPVSSEKPDKDDIVELRGTVEAGVEPGCLILQSGGKTYGLYGGDPNVLKAGAKVVVRGLPQPDMVTTCQQGIPFQVAEVHKV
jgi:hypothetical protein